MQINKYIRFWLPVFLWAGVIFAFSSQPTGSASEINYVDFGIKKLAHIIEYGIFTTLLFRAMYNSGVNYKKALYLALITAALYGASDEFHQGFTPGREPHFRDVIFDTIGASIAVYTIWKLLPIAPEPLKTLAKNFQILLKEEK